MSVREEIEALGFDVPDLIEPIVAYRSWSLISGRPSHTGYLYSHNGTPWFPGKPLKAECPYNNGQHRFHRVADSEKIPVQECSCGIYAAKREDAMSIVPRSAVYGEVYLWGKIVEGPNGYRAEYCYPKRFFVRDTKIKRVVERFGFGVPVTVVYGSPYGFPFPRGRVNLLYFPNFLLGIPAATIATIDIFTLNLANAFNDILVGMLYALGIAASAIGLLASRIARIRL